MAMYHKKFGPGSTIFREGELGDAAYVIEDGQVEISHLRGGKVVRIAVLGPGDLMGEMALVDDNVRMASATALTECELVVISKERVKAEIGQSSPLVDLFLRVILKRLRSTHGMMLRYRLNQEAGADRSPNPGEAAMSLTGTFTATRDKAISWLRVEDELRNAITRGELLMHYQPIVGLDDGNIAGFEALVRWNHPERGMVPPNDFIGIAENSGVIIPMGTWALGEASRALRRFQSITDGNAPRPLFMSINVSPRQLFEPGLVERFPEVLEETSVDPGDLKLELTESVLVHDPDMAIVALESLKAIGVKLVIDDFGTGYSSLSYLYRFPIDAIKIDRSFVATMGQERVSDLIVRAVTGLARSLELEVVAEGIEVLEQQLRLREMGCDFGQGYYFAKPLAADEVVAMLTGDARPADVSSGAE